MEEEKKVDDVSPRRKKWNWVKERVSDVLTPVLLILLLLTVYVVWEANSALIDMNSEINDYQNEYLAWLNDEKADGGFEITDPDIIYTDDNGTASLAVLKEYPPYYRYIDWGDGNISWVRRNATLMNHTYQEKGFHMVAIIEVYADGWTIIQRQYVVYPEESTHYLVGG